MKMKKILLTTACVLTIPTLAQAGDYQLPGEFSGTVGFVSEYSFRGIAQSDENPAVQASIDYSHDSGFYAGIWGSNVDFTDADIETDIYAGFSGEASNGLSWDVGGIYYVYPGSDGSNNYDFFEVAGAVGYDFDIAAVSGSVNYSPEYFGESGDATYVAGYVDVPLPYDVTLSGHYGYQYIDEEATFGVPDYADWSAGLSYNFSGFDLSATYIDTDLNGSECADGCDERVIAA
ncbi:TorF family putative porin, partial [Alphaproteobacteria bacterium]|nr:TorF family putative porin [Alphaproteobacteria bacterium]